MYKIITKILFTQKYPNINTDRYAAIRIRETVLEKIDCYGVRNYIRKLYQRRGYAAIVSEREADMQQLYKREQKINLNIDCYGVLRSEAVLEKTN